MTREQIDAFHSACREVVRACPDPYAKSYANVGLTLTDPEYIRVQCLYILGNMDRWRGEAAKWPRNTLKLLSKRQKGEK